MRSPVGTAANSVLTVRRHVPNAGKKSGHHDAEKIPFRGTGQNAGKHTARRLELVGRVNDSQVAVSAIFKLPFDVKMMVRFFEFKRMRMGRGRGVSGIGNMLWPGPTLLPGVSGPLLKDTRNSPSSVTFPLLKVDVRKRLSLMRGRTQAFEWWGKTLVGEIARVIVIQRVGGAGQGFRHRNSRPRRHYWKCRGLTAGHGSPGLQSAR